MRNGLLVAKFPPRKILIFLWASLHSDDSGKHNTHTRAHTHTHARAHAHTHTEGEEQNTWK